jgi:beta-glucanase (GH16 family)
VFTANTLDLTAVLPSGGGLFAGGITSGQIFTQQTLQPGVSGHQIYATEVRMKTPPGQGMWPASWFYVKNPGQTDASEIDNPEFFDMTSQNSYDWTGFNHGPGAGSDFYSIMNNIYVWQPGYDFSAAYHLYQTVWTTTAVYKYVDNVLVRATNFQWTAVGQASFIVNLAVGTSDTADLPGLQPTSTSEFPAVLSIDHIKIWGN